MAAAHVLSQNSRRGWRRYITPVFFVFAFVYLTFHALSGERGLYALFKEKRKLAVVQAELQRVNEKRSALEHRVRLMNQTSVDADLLDEQARDVLGLAGENEVIYYPPSK